MRYVSLRFGGYNFSANNEINGLTLGAVGRGTRIENIEVVSNTDDAFEWFGGTVNCRNLVAVFCNDDNLDMDFGFQGTVQNVLIVQNNIPGSQGADNAFEFSGVTDFALVGTGPAIADATKPVVFNVTAIGNGASGSTVLRTNSGFQGQVHNSVFLNYGRGIRTDDALTRGLVGVNGLRFAANTWVTPPVQSVNNIAEEFELYDGNTILNDEVATIADLKFKGAAIPVPASETFNPALASDSPLWAHNGATISKVSDIQELLTDNQRKDLQELPYRGAFGRSNWAAGWTYLSEKSFFDETPVVASGSDVNILGLVAPNDAVKSNIDYDGAGPLPAGVLHLTADKTYLLDDILFVESGATLIIDPGTVIYCESDPGADLVSKTDDTYGAILVARGGKIIAEGAPCNPIVMTTIAERDGLPVGNANAGQQPVAGRDGGLWGGVVILGRAPLTARDGSSNIIREKIIEGFAANESDTRVLYGHGASPAQPEESSGVLSYMSLRFGGYNFSANNEINGLTMGAVGRGTRIENIEVVSNTDDAFEWFGGTVNCRNLVAVFCNDDNLDMDFGFQGTVQNVLIVQNNIPGSQGADNALEFSGVTDFALVGTGPAIADATKPVVFNVTAIGNGASGSTVLRTNSGFQGQVHNSVFLNYGRGIRTDDALTRGLVGVNGLRFAGSTWVTPPVQSVNNIAQEFELYDGNTILNAEVDNFAQLFFRGDALPNQNSNSFEPQLAYASPLWGFNGAILSGLNDIQDLSTDNQRLNANELPYQGAFGVANWAACWTYLTQEGFFPGETATGAPPFADVDGDGISDTLEATQTLTDLGFSVGVNNVSGVNGNLFESLYDETSILDLRTVGQTMVQKDGSNNVTLTVPVEKSTGLNTWGPAGTMQLGPFPGDPNKEFYRLKVEGAQ
jgi:HAMP domain-containing protein